MRIASRSVTARTNGSVQSSIFRRSLLNGASETERHTRQLERTNTLWPLRRNTCKKSYFSLWPNVQHLGECPDQKDCDHAHKSRENTNAPLTWSIVSISPGLFCGIHSKSYGKKTFPVA